MEQARTWVGFAWAAAATVVSTLAGFAMIPRFDPVNVAMVYLLAVVVVALQCSRGPAIATAALSVLAFDVLFVPPVGELRVDDLQYLLTFAIMIAVAVVISGLKERLRREARAQARLAVDAEQEHLRATLLASISHDLRTPLAVMAGASSSLAERGERLPPAERAALARSVFEQSRELSEHVAKILDMTRLESGTLTPARDWCSMEEIVAAVLRRLESRLATHRLVVEVPGDLPLVRVDGALVEQALANLLENAARHTPKGTVVRLRARAVGRELVTTVEDYGGGIPAADVERVFAKFHQGRPEGGGGVGLGLAITRAIVLLHGGRAWADRVPEGGTAFHIALPIEPAPEVPRESGAPA
jgi:two-component system sensor histidine kinase KdpD